MTIFEKQEMPAFATAREYLIAVQSPRTRIKDPVELLKGANAALLQFKDPHLIASALCVIIYRYLERPELRPSIDLQLVNDKFVFAKEGLIDKKDLGSLRWFLSLNMAYGNLQVLLDCPEMALTHLRENAQRKDEAISYGQPFTNVVKSVVSLLAILKYRKLDPVFYEDVPALLQAFGKVGGEVSANYRFVNQFVYDELALVFRTVSAISKLHYEWIAMESGDPALLVSRLEDGGVPGSFLKVLKPK